MMEDLAIVSNKYYTEVFTKKCMLIKLMSFLLDEDKCRAAGYTHYSKYRRGYGAFCHQIILLGYNHVERENIKIDIIYRQDKPVPIHWIYASCIGDRPLKYMRSIIKTFCLSKNTHEMKLLLTNPNSSCVLINTKIVSDAEIDYEDDKFILKVLKTMRMAPEETHLFPTVDTTEGTCNLNTFTLENLHMTDKVFNAIIEGITNNI